MNRRQFLTGILGVSGVAAVADIEHLIDLDKPIRTLDDMEETKQIAHSISPNHYIVVKIGDGDKECLIPVGTIT